MKTKSKSNWDWGGRRPGAGRKPDPAKMGERATCQLAKLIKWAASQQLDATRLQTSGTILAAWLAENVKERTK